MTGLEISIISIGTILIILMIIFLFHNLGIKKEDIIK